MTAHKYFAYSSLICMGMSIYSGHKLVSPKKKKITKSNNSGIVKQKNSFIHKDKVAGEFFLQQLSLSYAFMVDFGMNAKRLIVIVLATA